MSGKILQGRSILQDFCIVMVNKVLVDGLFLQRNIVQMSQRTIT